MSSDVSFPTATIFGYAIAILFYFLLPIVASILLYRRQSAHVFPLVVGVVVYLLTTRINDIGVQMFFRGQSYANMMAIAAETVCLWEECGRWLVMRYPLTGIRSAGAAASYGIGHGGIEAVLRGAQKCNILAIGLRLNREGISGFTSVLDPKFAANIVVQLQEYASRGLFCNLLDSLDAASNFGVHIALSMLIYRGVQRENSRQTLPIAIGLHYLVNLCGWLASFSNSIILRDAVGITAGVFVIWLAMKIADGRALFDEIMYPAETE